MAIGLFALITVAHATIGPDRTDVPRLIMVMFKSGDTATFALTDNTSLPNGTNGTVQSLQLQVSGKYYEVPLADCRSLKNVHAETARFVDSEPVKRKAGTFTFIFQMGDEGTRRFGVLPQVQINFVDGRFVGPSITVQTSEDSGFTSPLCFAPL